MNKVLAACLIAITVTGFSQTTYGQGTWGAEAGANLANIKGDDISDDTDIRTAFLIGVYYQPQFDSKLSKKTL